MMKKFITILLCIIGLFTSCQKQQSSKIATIDFGTGEYAEPFRGLLSSQPSWLVATLDWPIFNRLKPDTVVLSKTIEIGFNEDAVRSNSTARLMFVDENGNIPKDYQFFCNNKPIEKNGFELKASPKPQKVNIKVKVHPRVGDSAVSGHILISSTELDEVNAVALTGDDMQRVAQWSFAQEIDWPLLIWIFWLVLLLVALAVIAGLIYALWKLSLLIWSFLGTIFGGITPNTTNFNRITTNFNKIKDKKNDTKIKEKKYIWLQESGEQNQLLNEFKISEPQTLDEAYLQSYIHWDEKDYSKAKRFKKQLHRYIKKRYHSYYRFRFIWERLRDDNVPFIWIGSISKNHLNNLTIVHRTADKKYLRNCLYFPNTKRGYERAQRLLQDIKDYIRENHK